uniref:Uncharacterized protein n=1 Tax=Acrobeloides nanus TaxID=290746 RepID=A0A914E5L1_9BILA
MLANKRIVLNEKLKLSIVGFNRYVSQISLSIKPEDFEKFKNSSNAQFSILLQDLVEKSLTSHKTAIQQTIKEDLRKWAAYNDALIKIVQEQKAMGMTWCKKLDDKWAKAPPIEHWNKEHYQEYLPYVYEYCDPKRETEPRLPQSLHFYINKPHRKILHEIRHRDGKLPPETLFKLHTLRPVYRSHAGSQIRLHWDKIITFCVAMALLHLYIGP